MNLRTLARMGTPFGDFIRATRDATQPEDVGLVDHATHGRRRAPGLRRVDLAGRAGISVEYLTRIEQGRDRNPSIAVVNALADALSLSPDERTHLRYLAKISGGECTAHDGAAPASREVRPDLLATLRLLEPALAIVTNRLGDVLAHTDAFDAVLRPSGLLDDAEPNLTRYVFTHPRARALFPQWDVVADERAFDLWTGPTVENVEWFIDELTPIAGAEFLDRLNRPAMPSRGALHLRVRGADLHLRRETLEVLGDAQQIVVFLPADEASEATLARLRDGGRRLRTIS